MPSRKARISPVTAFVRSIEGGPWFTTCEAAVSIGTTEGSLRRWMHKDVDLFGPSFDTTYGKLKIYLWSAEDIARVAANYEAYRQAQPGRFVGRPGRVRVWSVLEKESRDARLARASYYRRAAKTLAAKGRHLEAEIKLADAAIITRDLRVEHDAKMELIQARLAGT